MVLDDEDIKKALKEVLPKLSAEDILKVVAVLRVASCNWQEVNVKETIGAQISVQCKDICALGEAFDKGLQIRAFVKKK